MKLALLGNSPKGICLFRLEMINAMIREGIAVTVIFPSDAESPSRASAVISTLKAAGAKAELISLERARISPSSDMRYYYSIRRILGGAGYDAVLAYGIKPIVFGLSAAAAVGVPLRLAMVTGLGSAFIDVRTLKKRLVYGIACLGYKWALSQCQHVFFQNDDDLKAFQSLGLIVRTQDTSIVPGSGIPLSHYQAQPVPDVSNGLRFIFVGRLLYHKGLLDYLEAAQRMTETRQQKAEFWVVGGEDANPSSLKLVDLRQAYPSVQFFGEVSDVRTFLSQAHVFVLPSFREGTSRSALEAMATGRPIIVTDVPGCRHLVQSGKNGFLIKLQDPEGLCAAMQAYIDSPELCVQHGKAGRKLVEERFDVNIVNQHIIDTLRRLEIGNSV